MVSFSIRYLTPTKCLSNVWTESMLPRQQAIIAGERNRMKGSLMDVRMSRSVSSATEISPENPPICRNRSAATTMVPLPSTAVPWSTIK